MLEAHWDSWVTAADFAWLASRGVNTVRLPISYYHLVGLDPSLLAGTEFEPFAPIYAGAWERIQRAFALADQHGLGVLVDLHAVPGKQNADAHAGVSHHGPLLFDKSKYQDQTVRVLEALVGAVCQVENVVGCVASRRGSCCAGRLDPGADPGLALPALPQSRDHERAQAARQTRRLPQGHARPAPAHLRARLPSVRRRALLVPRTCARASLTTPPFLPCAPRRIVGDSWDLGGGLKTYFPDQNFTVLVRRSLSGSPA